MEPPPAPPLSAAASTVTAAGVVPPPPQTHLGYADSVDSSPRSRNTDSWDESLYPSATGGGGPVKLRLMCSYGGHIVPRPHSKSLCYVGGDTRIVVVDRHTTLSDLTHRLSKTLFNGRSFTLKYQLPNEDLDSLISVTTDEDLENMIDEYDRLTSAAAAAAAATAAKSSRLRLFLFPSKPDSASSIGSLLENSTKSDDWFLNALNGTSSGFSESASVNCLLGLDDDAVITPNGNSKDVETQIESFGNVKGASGGGGGGSKHGGQDVHSVPDSPMLETTSSFGSASSSPSLANLPPIRVHVEDQKVGIEEQFSQMSVMENAQQKHDDGGFMVLSSQPTTLTTVTAAPISGVPMSSPPIMAEYPNRVFSDDERSEQGIPIGYRKLPAPQAQFQQHPQIQYMPQQLQPKQTGGLDSVSPDSVSSEGSIKNPLSRQKPTMIYQEPIVQIPSTQSKGTSGNPVEQPKITDPNTRVQMNQMHQQQLQDSGYILQTQFDPQQQMHPQMHPQQQFIHAGAQYIHHHPTGMPMASYYPIYPSQQQHHPQHAGVDQQYPVYYMPARQTQAYNMSVQQPSYSESAPTTAPSSRPQTPPPAAMAPPQAAYNPARNAPAPKPDLASGGYRTATTAAPMVQVPSSQYQAQYVGYSQIHHPSQSIAPTSAANSNYAYEFADPAQAHMYYTQLAAQYQTMAASGLAEDNMKQQQVGTSQP